jgi:hypothetical protein
MKPPSFQIKPLFMIRTIFFLSILVFAGSCNFSMKKVRGDGKVTTVERKVSGFREVSLSGSMDVYVSQGPAYSVRVETDGNLQDYIELDKDGDELNVRTRKRYNLQSTSGIKVYITAPNYTDLTVSGGGNIRSQTRISGNEELEIQVAGSGNVFLDVHVPSLSSNIAGSGSIVLSGATGSFESDITGSGDIKAFSLLSETADIEITGSGNAEVAASRQLNADITGSGDIFYRGNPSVKTSRTGSGDVKKAD